MSRVEVIPVLVLLCYIQLTNFTYPFNKPFSEIAQGKIVWVPSRKIAQEERFRFKIPGSNPIPYNADGSVHSTCENSFRDTLLVLEGDHIKECGRKFVVKEVLPDLKSRQSFSEILQIATGHSELLIQKLFLVQID